MIGRRETQTDANGNYLFTGLTGGTYIIRVTAAGRVRQQHRQPRRPA